MKKTLQKSRKAGRPPVATAKLRRERVEIKVTTYEKAELIKAASSEGQTLANWIRHRLGLEAAEYGG